MDVFINEPTDVNGVPFLSNIHAKFDLGSFIVRNSRNINFFVGIDLSGKSNTFIIIELVYLFVEF